MNAALFVLDTQQTPSYEYGSYPESSKYSMSSDPVALDLHPPTSSPLTLSFDASSSDAQASSECSNICGYYATKDFSEQYGIDSYGKLSREWKSSAYIHNTNMRSTAKYNLKLLNETQTYDATSTHVAYSPQGPIPSWKRFDIHHNDHRVTKRRRTCSDSPIMSRYATESAAIRKARSLRSDASYNVDRRTESTQAHTPSMSPVGTNTSQGENKAESPIEFVHLGYDLSSDYVPTRPTTPISPPSSIFTVPEYPILPIFLKPDEIAERRLRRLLEREKQSRRAAGFEDRRCLSSWTAPSQTLLEPLALSFEEGRSERDPVSLEENAYRVTDFRTEIGTALREEIVEWMLTVVPPHDRKRRPSARNLRDQLMKCPDTSFLSVYLFGQYLWTVAPPHFSESQGEGNRGEFDESDGTRMLSYELALAALAISVKYHRDFLHPLAPVYACDFIALAKYTISFEDFELAQRDILLGLLYDLNIPTPQPILDELREASPLLRRAVPEHQWKSVLQDVWWQLLHAIRQPDVFRWPVSLLTLAALRETFSRETKGAIQCDCKRTGISMNDVCQDIQDLLGYSEAVVEDCDVWLQEVCTAVLT